MPAAHLPSAVEAIVVGGGAAGLTAATWLGRYRRTTVLLDAADGRNRVVDQSHGYLGADPVRPAELVDGGRRGLERYPTVHPVAARAVDARRVDGGFTVRLDDGREVGCRAVVLCTGARDHLPDIQGFGTHYGADVVHCLACDGFEVQGRRVVVLGWGEHVPGLARLLEEWAEWVTVVTHSRRLEVDEDDRRALPLRGIEVVDDEAVEFVGPRGALEGVRLRSGRLLGCSVCFFSVGHEPNADLAGRLGCARTPEGCVLVDRDGRTSVDGVYAAGDLTPGAQLLQVAAGEGAAAGNACAQWLAG